METRTQVTTVAIISAMIWLGMNVNVTAYPDVRHVTHTCEGDNDPQGDYQQCLDIAVPRVINRTPRYGYDYYTWTVIRRSRAYARGVCNGQISQGDCNICLRVADRALYDACHFPEKAYIQLIDCQLKFQNRPFTRIP